MKSSISKQFLTVGLIIVLAFSGLILYSYLQVKEIELQYRQALLHDAPAVGYAKEIVSELWRLNAHVRGYMLTGDAQYLQYVKESKQRVDDAATAIGKISLSPEARKEFDLIRMIIDDYYKTMDGSITTRDKMGVESSIKLLKAGGGKINGIGDVTAPFIKVIEEEMAENTRVSQQKIATLQIVMAVSVAGILLAAVAMLLAMARKIGRPLALVVEAANRIASGDFRENAIAYKKQDEIGGLINAFTAMRSNLRALVQEITHVSGQVASASGQLTNNAEQSATAAGQIAATVTDVAAGASTQVNAIEQAVTIVKQMAVAINHIAERAANVSGKSGETAQAAAAGGQAVADATAQMQVINNSVSQSAQVVKRLGESSKQIGEIVDVISGIAGQTNLLALNAAIEAARAGAQGRGFAVVAEEVRKLAEQSQEAAGKIADIIREIQNETDTAVAVMNQGTEEVARGTQVITQTGSRFQAIVSLVQELNQQIQEISAAAEELAASSEAVVSSVDSVKTVAGETAGNTQTISAAAEEQSASMEEIAASSQTLSRLAEDLQNAVAKFKL
ncbi:MAG: methyl-accepting chemotaxis protein [Negativicutes bacterium]|nr:methyl-accepting chemotaxis protein [Negativicutes bacterium]